MRCSEIIEDATDRFLELYGDRKEGLGKSIQGGMAWIAGAKVVLMAVCDQCTPEAVDLRRMSRLIDLAVHLKRPILSSLQLLSDLENGLYLQDIGIRKEFATTFLKLVSHPFPIVTVADHSLLQTLDTSLSISDSLLIRGNVSVTEFDQACVQNGQQIIRSVDDGLGLKGSISAMFAQLLAVQKDDLVKRRKNRLQHTSS